MKSKASLSQDVAYSLVRHISAYSEIDRPGVTEDRRIPPIPTHAECSTGAREAAAFERDMLRRAKRRWLDRDQIIARLDPVRFGENADAIANAAFYVLREDIFRASDNIAHFLDLADWHDQQPRDAHISVFSRQNTALPAEYIDL